MADIDAKTWLETVIINDPTMAANSATDVASQASIKAYTDQAEADANSYTDAEIAALDFATEGYVDAGLATKQNIIYNGIETLTSSEVNQLKNIDSRIITNTSWNVVSGLQGDSDPRVIDGNPSSAWTYAYIPLTPEITDTSSVYGYYHFWLWQDNGITSSEYMEVQIRVPINCYYDGTSNPPEIVVLPRGIGTQKFNRIIASNMGTSGHVKFFLEIANNGDGVLDLYLRDAADTMLPSLSAAGTPTETLANQTNTMVLYRQRSLNSLYSGGSVKIDSNGDTSEPTFTLVSGVPQQVIYTSPAMDATSVYPPGGPSDSTCIYDEVNDVFLEQPVIGLSQYWRVSFSYSNKSINSAIGFYLRMVNPISGFVRRLLCTLPIGETANDFLTVDVSTYADSNSLAPPLGTGLGGYELWVEALGGLDVVIKDVARFTNNF